MLPSITATGVQRDHSHPLIAKLCSKSSDIVTSFFQTAVMLLQYPLVQGSITLRQWYVFSSAVHWKYQEIPIRNIASLRVWFHCLKTSIWPLPKSMFNDIGRTEGLRITNSITLYPSSGLCLGMSLAFLAQLKQDTSKNSLLAAAKVFRWGGNEASVRVQAIYEALMDSQDSVKSQDRKFFASLLQEGASPSGTSTFPQLQASIQTFMARKNNQDTLRKFVLDDLESKGMEITPDIYAFVLDLDIIWQQKMTKSDHKNDAVHYAITSVAAKCLNLELAGMEHSPEDLEAAKRHLQNLAAGRYLLQFSRHTTALVKTAEAVAIFEPNACLGYIPLSRQNEAISRLLDFHGSNDNISLKIISVRDDNIS